MNERRSITHQALGDVILEKVGDEVQFDDILTAGLRAQASSVKVNVFVGDDGATVVQIDTNGDDRLRVNVNDSTVFDKGVESGAVHEHHPREWVVIEDASWNNSDAVDVFDLSFLNDKRADPAEAFDDAVERVADMRGRPGLEGYVANLETWIADRMAE